MNKENHTLIQEHCTLAHLHIKTDSPAVHYFKYMLFKVACTVKPRKTDVAVLTFFYRFCEVSAFRVKPILIQISVLGGCCFSLANSSVYTNLFHNDKRFIKYLFSINRTT